MKFFLKTEYNDERTIFITGNFNNWNPRDKRFSLQQADEGYCIEINDEILPSEIEYKFTKGGWENVEIDSEAQFTPNRKVKKKAKEVEDIVEGWRLNWAPFKEEYFPKIELISENFYIPQLNKTRKVWALLPYDYETTEKSYPVLYLQDAQNLFNEDSPFGNWEIDKKLSLLAEYGIGDIIIIAVEHGSEYRIQEYVFEDDNEYAVKAEGKKYIRFITDTLKPYVDQHFRTLPDREHTGIGGSSLGALISIYGGFLYPEVYSKLMLFSPSLWLNPNNNFPMLSFHQPYYTKAYIYGGEPEGSDMVKRINLFKDAMSRWEESKSIEFEVRTSIHPEGKHEEFYWSQEFPRALEWLFFDKLENPVERKKRYTKEKENV
ncbi:alpha/beta hydrolase-fold protein [Sphingobacterium spiritivorum]|uniref:alpha/beta hydrolase-fold protein n=1 Tax=Sphingobacterium spiritivorum TaxID=258 RepID=UPI003DA5E36A